MNADRIPVIVADDHPVSLMGLRGVVESSHDMRLVGVAVNAQEVLGAAREGRADVLLLEGSMASVDIADVLRKIGEVSKDLAVLVVGGPPEAGHAIRCLEAGAAGFVPASASIQEVQEAVRTVARGQVYATSAVMSALASKLGGGSVRPHDFLSTRELQVFQHLASGRSAREIAEELGLSPKTIATYRARIVEKTHLKTLAEFVRYAIDNGLMPSGEPPDRARDEDA